MTTYDPIEITRLLVFGTNSPSPDDYNKHIRPTSATPASISYNMNTYMTIGGGRFAYPSLFGVVKKFFGTTIPNGTYNYSQIASLLSLSPSDIKISISQYSTGIGSADHAERSYIFGSTSFELNTAAATFEVINGVKRIKGMEVRALEDNFDFESVPGAYSQFVNDVLLKPTFDPYGLGRGKVTINFTGQGKTYTSYSQENFVADKVLESNVNGSLAIGISSLVVNGGIPYFLNIASDTFLGYTHDGMTVIYGTPNDDNLNKYNSSWYPWYDIGYPPTSPSSADYLSYLIVGGAGNDRLTGENSDDEIQGGEGNDTMDGGLGDDTFIGGKGDDTMDGGSFLFGLFQGTDKSVYTGALADYDVEFLPDDLVQISDKVAGRDGTDTLKGVDIGVFSDKSLKLAPGQDIAFVIDTTGSMWDDIAAVKDHSSDIINAIFNGDHNVLNSRIAIVGYNDPWTTTFLPFTDQPKISDRKTAAINAINSISVGGGGDIPEMVNAGLIRTLDGHAGQWRKEAIARRIVLFGDAPPKDTELHAQVLNLAANVGGSLPGSPTPLSIVGDIETSTLTDGLALTTFSMTMIEADATEVTFPVQIFTVLIGNSSTTKAYFESLAAATGGKAFNAANASEVVEALIAAIETPLNEAPIAQDDGATAKQGTAVNVAVLDNDSDPDDDTLTIESFSQGSRGIVTQSGNFLSYTPATQLDPTVGFIDSFTYTLSDGNGGTDTAKVTVAVGKIKNGGNGKDYLNGTPGDDVLSGGNDKDTLIGMEGNDVLSGNNGQDILMGRLGDDLLTGGNGNDTFGLAAGDGTDLITDFKQGNDNFGLIGNLSFGSNVSAQILSGETLILSNGEPLARLTGEFTLTGSDFVLLVGA